MEWPGSNNALVTPSDSRLLGSSQRVASLQSVSSQCQTSNYSFAASLIQGGQNDTKLGWVNGCFSVVPREKIGGARAYARVPAVIFSGGARL